jgi:hypothetical protein
MNNPYERETGARSWALAAVCVALTSCNPTIDDAPPDLGPQGPPVAATGGAATGPSASCTSLGSLTLSGAHASIGTNTPPWNVVGAALPAGPLGTGTNEIWVFNTATAPRTLGSSIHLEDSAANRSYATATETMIVAVDCPSTGGLLACRRLFQSVLGLARFDAVASAAGDAFSGSFSSVELREVRLDPTTYQSQFTGSGDCVSVDLFSFSATANPPAGSCDSYTACDTCTGAAGCGWCSNVGRCLGGASTGPTDSACSGSQWSWTSNMCRADAGVPVDTGVRVDTGVPVDTGTTTPDVGVRDTGTPDAGTVTMDAGGLGGSGSAQASESGGASHASNASPYVTCATTSSCGSAAPNCLHGTGQTAGVCSASCTHDSACGSGGVCISFGTSGGYCLRPCPSSGCDSGLHCGSYASTSRLTTSVCVPTYW